MKNWGLALKGLICENNFFLHFLLGIKRQTCWKDRFNRWKNRRAKSRSKHLNLKWNPGNRQRRLP